MAPGKKYFFAIFLCCLIADSCQTPKNTAIKKDGYGKSADSIARILSSFIETPEFVSAKQKLFLLAEDGNEWSTVFCNNNNNQFFYTHFSSLGKENAGVVKDTCSLPFADLHNHPDGNGPSAGDIYGLLGLANKHPNYSLRLVATKDSVLYALYIFDREKASLFRQKFPAEIVNNIPSFPLAVMDVFREVYGTAKFTYAEPVAYSIAIAYILEMYNTGICLLKQNKNEKWVVLRTQREHRSGILFYKPINPTKQ